MHAQQTRVACTARERSEMEAKESPQAQIAKLQQQLQELQVRYAAECKRSEQLELAVRNKDLQLAELQSADKEARPTGLGEVNKTAKERPHWDEQNDSDGSGMPSEGSSASTFSKMDPSDDVPNFPKDSVLRTQSADVEVACGQLFPLLLDFLPVDEVVRFNIRAVSRFFASPKAWVFHLFKLTDIDSLPTSSSEKQMHPVVECFHKCKESEKEGPKTVERRARLIREYLLGTSERCRGFILWMYNLHRWRLYQPDLVHHFIDVCLEVLDYIPTCWTTGKCSLLDGIASAWALSVAWIAIAHRPSRDRRCGRSQEENNCSHGNDWDLQTWACLSMHRQAFLGRVRQDYDFWWSITQPLLPQSNKHGRHCPGRWSCLSCCFQETFTSCLVEPGNALRSQAWAAWVAGGMTRIRLRETISVRARRWS